MIRYFLIIVILFFLVNCKTFRNEIYQSDKVDKKSNIGLYLTNKLSQYQYDITRFFYIKDYKVYRIKYYNNVDSNTKESIGLIVTDLEVNQINKVYFGILENLNEKSIKYLITLDYNKNCIYTEVWNIEKKELIYSQSYDQEFKAIGDDYLLEYINFYLIELDKNISYENKLKDRKTKKDESKKEDIKTKDKNNEKSLFDYLNE